MSLSAIEKAKQRRHKRAVDKDLAERQISAQVELKQSVDTLSERLADYQAPDFALLEEQLKLVAKQPDLAPILKSLEKSLKEAAPHTKLTEKIKIHGFSGLLTAIKSIKPQVIVESRDVSQEYKASDAAVDSGSHYFGFLHPTGKWYLLRQSGANGGIFRYVNGVDDYEKAWASRAKLSYRLYSEIEL